MRRPLVFTSTGVEPNLGTSLDTRDIALCFFNRLFFFI